MCSLSDSGNWTNQNVVFTKALLDMFPLAKAIVQGRWPRDECRGAHFKPDFAMPSLTADDAGRTAARGRSLVRSVRGQQSQVAEVDHRDVESAAANSPNCRTRTSTRR